MSICRSSHVAPSCVTPRIGDALPLSELEAALAYLDGLIKSDGTIHLADREGVEGAVRERKGSDGWYAFDDIAFVEETHESEER